MSQPMAATACSPLALNKAAQLQCPNTSLRAAYEEAQEALTAASSVVAGIASGLYDLESSQTDVSARLTGRASRVIGKKRKLSPSIYDYSESGFFAASKADTPTQELLPASRSELRHHQLQAVRWLASLELQRAGGVLADELEQDRRAEVAGLLSHLASNPPDPHFPTPMHMQMPQGPGQQCHGGLGGQQQQLGGGGGASSNTVLLLAPECTLPAWSEAISEHVDVTVQVYDGSPASTAALHAACAAGSAPSPMLRPGAAATRRTASGGAGLGSSAAPSGGAGGGNSSAAGIFPPVLQPPPPLQQQLFRQCVAGHSKLLLVLAPLEQLQRDASVLSQLPQRMLIVDLAAGSGGYASRRDASGSGGGAAAASGDSTGSAHRPFGPASYGFVGSSSGPRSGPYEQQWRRAEGMDLEGYPHLHLLTHMPAPSRVLLSAGMPEPAGNATWLLLQLLLQLLVPSAQQPLWQAVSELQQGLLAVGDASAQCREALGELTRRLWALLRPLVLHRRAREVDLSTMRATTTSLNLYDHFSAAKADGGM